MGHTNTNTKANTNSNLLNLLKIFSYLLSHNAFLLVDPLVNVADRLHPVRVCALPLQPPELPVHLEMAPACQLQPTPGQPSHWIASLDQPSGQTGELVEMIT